MTELESGSHFSRGENPKHVLKQAPGSSQHRTDKRQPRQEPEARSKSSLRVRFILRTTAKEPLKMATKEPLKMATKEPLKMATKEPLKMETKEPLKMETKEPLKMATKEPLETAPLK
eukprot:scaffold23471_cov141-Cylindrotheca_fusiformis.AAC.12